jgi:REP element-mobilizing transposase RayT
MHARRPHRIQNFPYLGGYRYFVTCCTDNHARAFVSPPSVAALTTQLLRTCDAHSFAVLAYVFMPDHLHFLVEGRSDQADFRGAMRVIRQRLTVTYHTWNSGDLWQDGYHERVLRDEEATAAVAEYIVANPVRAGLVENARDYPFSWSIEWEADQALSRRTVNRSALRTASSADQSSVRPTYCGLLFVREVCSCVLRR